ncbi:MAG: hypothetical protein MAG794_01694 [Gammaproteobacteria bacterium]|nr:hypothetical protein [Gammaproteobacteria bacterium]
MRRTMTPVAVSLLAIALAACGSDEPEPASGPAKPAVTARAGAGDPPRPR